MRKIASILLSASIIFTLAGCGGQSRAEAPSVSQPSSESVGAENTSAESPSQPSGQPAGGADGQVENPPSDNSGSGAGKTLVVYYSATGHTDAVAGYIAEALGGDLFKLEPAEPYSSDDLNWTDGDSRVSREHDNPDARNVELVAATVDNWDSYSNVFIGYPI